MEIATQTESHKIHKTPVNVLKAVNKYDRELKIKNPEQYQKKLQMNRERYNANKQKLKEALEKIKMYESKFNESNSNEIKNI